MIILASAVFITSHAQDIGHDSDDTANQAPEIKEKSISSVPFKKIGKVVPRTSKEIESSSWSIGCETLDRDLANYDSYKNYLGKLGVKNARLQGGWAKTERKAGVYDFKWQDDIVNDMISQGVRPWIELSYGNPIYKDGGGATLGDGMPRSEEALKAWDRWAKALVQRYKDRVSTWAVWNEPEVTKEVSVLEYVNLYIRTATMIKSEQPDSRIYALSLAGKIDYADGFLKALKEQDKLDLVDAISFHGYPYNPDHMGLYVQLKSLVEKYSSRIALVQGETGAPSGKTTGALRDREWTELTQAKWDLRRMMVHYGNGIPVNLFSCCEFIYDDARRRGLNAKGLIAIKEDKSFDHLKPAYFAAQNVYSIFDDTLVLEKKMEFSFSGTKRTPTVYSWRKRNSQMSVAAIWFGGAPCGESNELVPVDLVFKDAKFENPVYVDLRTGEVYEFPPSNWSQDGNTVKFLAMPLYDSPVLIADKSAIQLP